MHPRACIAQRGGGCVRPPLVQRINGQPVKFKALAGFVAGPSLIWSAMSPGSLLARAAAGTVGVLVTLIDGGHVIRQWRRKRLEG